MTTKTVVIATVMTKTLGTKLIVMIAGIALIDVIPSLKASATSVRKRITDCGNTQRKNRLDPKISIRDDLTKAITTVVTATLKTDLDNISLPIKVKTTKVFKLLKPLSLTQLITTTRTLT
jgi:hypothetical protein